MHVQRLAISHCAFTGLSVGEGGLVLENRVSNTGGSGISMGSNTAFGSNVVTDTGLSASGTSSAFVGGQPVGGNVCDDGSCTPPYAPLRRYYLSQSPVPGGQALDQCAEGFHMASLWEIWSPSGLRYDTDLGAAGTDSASGPPAVLEGIGWVRGLSGFGPLSSNCQGWSVSVGPSSGTVASLNLIDAPDENPWATDSLTCSTPVPVWCVED